MPETLSDLALQLLRDRVRLRASLTAPVLVWMAPSEPHPLASWEHTDAGTTKPTVPSPANPLVFRVTKRPGPTNAFAMAVTLGRIDSNDVQLDDASVSRFHAYLQKDAKTGQWLLTDAESNNGTFLDGVRLKPNVKTPVQDKARLRVGSVELRFFLPQAFLSYLENPLR